MFLLGFFFSVMDYVNVYIHMAASVHRYLSMKAEYDISMPGKKQTILLTNYICLNLISPMLIFGSNYMHRPISYKHPDRSYTMCV